MYQLARREGNSKKPIYEIHKWWARRLGHVFRSLLIGATTAGREGVRPDRALWRRFYSRNNLRGLTVLDPFMGGGTSVVEALKCGARVIGVDVDPVAWFVTKNEVAHCDLNALETAYALVAKKVEGAIRQAYQTTDPDTGEARETVNVFWVTEIHCPECKLKFDAHPHFRLEFNEAHSTQTVFCSNCGDVRAVPLHWKTFTCSSCSQRTAIMAGPVANGGFQCPECDHEGKLFELATAGRPLSKRIFAIEYSVQPKEGKPIRRFKRVTTDDLKLYRRIKSLFQQEKHALRFPRASIFKRRRFDRRPIMHGYDRYEQLFSDRQLYCLSLILGAILEIPEPVVRQYMLVAFSDCLASNNWLVSYAFGYQKTTPLFAIHGYKVPQRPVEGNVWGNPNFGRGSFSRCFAKLVAGKRYALRPFEYSYSAAGVIKKIFTNESICTKVVSSPTELLDDDARACLLNRSSINLSVISNASVDLVLTDPPFYNNLPYSELADFYYQWLKVELNPATVSNPHHQSLLVRGKNRDEHQIYVQGLTDSLAECDRVLKPEGMLVFTFHHKDPAAWHALGTALAGTKFYISAISPVRAEGVSGFHTYAGTPKWDAVVCCRKTPKLPQQKPFDRLHCLQQIIKEEKYWSKRLHKKKVPWSLADSSSFAFALAMRAAVNRRWTQIEFSVLLEEASRLYPQKGIHSFDISKLANLSKQA